MVIGKKFALRIALASALLAGVSAPAHAASGPSFDFQTDVIWLDLGPVHHKKTGFGVWDDDGADPWSIAFGHRAKSAPVTPAAAQPAAETQDNAFFPRLELIKLDAPRPVQIGHAGSYGADFDGRLTSTGERFDMYRLTAASADLPLNSFVSVSNLVTGETVTVRINDRRPATDGQLITLSQAAANRLGLDEVADAQVKVQYLGKTDPAAPRPMQVASR